MGRQIQLRSDRDTLHYFAHYNDTVAIRVAMPRGLPLAAFNNCSIKRIRFRYSPLKREGGGGGAEKLERGFN